MTIDQANNFAYSTGGIKVIDSNIKFQNNTFFNNTGMMGGGINIDGSFKSYCNVSIVSNYFENGAASLMGGAIYYNLYRPAINNNVYIDNVAAYGENIGSYPVRIVKSDTLDHKNSLSNIASGLKVGETLEFILIDYDNQILNLENENTIKISPTSQNAKLRGTDYAKLNNGSGVFNDLYLIYTPGADDIEYSISSKAINIAQVKAGLNLTEEDYNAYFKSTLNISFRYGMPGEKISSDQKEGQLGDYGSYSLKWNSAHCQNCMSNVRGEGEDNIFVNNKYWRRSTNSTSIIKCPNPEACIGGYEPDQEHPVRGKIGYKGYLCTECDIVNGTKFQPFSHFKGSKCLDPLLNIIRLIGVSLIALLFLTLIIIVNIRKKNENQLSILLRILTNYMHLITVAMSFNIEIPSNFSQIFSNSNRIGSPDDTLFSFDCFIDYTEVRLFMSSNKIFKIFLLGLLPLILILGVGGIVLIIKGIEKLLCSNMKLSGKRYIVISSICIVFLFHPILSLESLKLFQGIQVDDGIYHMQVDMNIKGYSYDHLFWAGLIGIPILIVWVLGGPIFVLVIITKNRNKLEEPHIKKYLLILYQGLKPKIFYWEFVNSLRKLLLMCIIVFLSVFSVVYQIMFSTILVIILIRVQLTLQPYKQSINNDIEVLAMKAGAFTIFVNVLFLEGSTISGFRMLAVILLFIFNGYFILNWIYLILLSFKSKKKCFQKLVQVTAVLLGKQPTKQKDDQIDVEKKEKLEKPKQKRLNKNKVRAKNASVSSKKWKKRSKIPSKF